MIQTIATKQETDRSRIWISLFILTLFTLLTFVNSWPDALVLDDKIFFGPESEHRLESLAGAFSRDLWNDGGSFYRPLLAIDFELQNRLFGAWQEGYHLVNILFHLVTTLSLFGFLRYFLRATQPDAENALFYALLAALVFAVHPVHTEVVNSAFNKSSMYVSLAAITGLWWLHSNLISKPVRAWVGFGLMYSVAILFKESALVLPGIAAAMIVLFTDGTLKERIRRFLPVFWLLVPIAAYFWLRAVVLAPAGAGTASPPGFAALFREIAFVLPVIAVTIIVLFTYGKLKDRIRRFLPVFWLLVPIAAYFLVRAVVLSPAGIDKATAPDDLVSMFGDIQLVVNQSGVMMAVTHFGQGLKLLVWPYPLRLYYPNPEQLEIVVYISMQIVLGAWAIYLLAKGRPMLIFSLIFYYMALLPSIHLISVRGELPLLTERSLYFPSVGLTFALAAGFQKLSTRLERKHLLIIMLPVILALATISWDRNADWKSAVHLFETEYQLGSRERGALRVIVAAHYNYGRYDRVAEICDDNLSDFQKSSSFLLVCGKSYLELNRSDDAIAALEMYDRGGDWIKVRLLLASIYKARKQYQEVVSQYAAIIDRVKDPATKDLYKGEMLLAVFPDDREQLELARSLFQQALALDPELDSARKRIDLIDKKLEKPDTTSGSDDPN